MDTFQYKPLESDGNQIRLLRRAEDSGAQPCYTLHTFNLDECPPYEALSYTWGPTLDTKPITLDGEPFMVRENLWHFLDHIGRIGIAVLDQDCRSLEHPYYFWIDQICIDQSSNGEKSHQVKCMAPIFRRAQRVIVWLGCEDHDSGMAMRQIADMATTKAMVHLTDKSYAAHLRRLKSSHESVANLLRRSFWSRLWIVQEVLLAREVAFACGPQAVTLEAFPNTIYEYSSRPHVDDLHLQIFHFGVRWNPTIPDNVRHLFKIRSANYGGVLPGLQLISLLRVFSSLECADSRDKVYGLFGLCDDKHGINVDYSKTAQQIFCEVFSYPGQETGWADEWFFQIARDMGVELETTKAGIVWL